MKKIVRCFWILILMFLVSGCTSAEEKKEKDDFKALESFGLSEKQAKNFYGYSNSAKLMFNTMTEVNKKLSENDYKVSKEHTESLYAASNTLEDYFVSMVGEDDYLDSFLWKTEGPFGGPQNTLKNIQEYKREISINEAAIMYDNLSGYASESLEKMGISKKDHEKLLKWYHNNNKYSGIFNEVHKIQTK